MKKQTSPMLETEQSGWPVERLQPAPPSDSPSTVLRLIERVALDPRADGEKLERIPRGIPRSGLSASNPGSADPRRRPAALAGMRDLPKACHSVCQTKPFPLHSYLARGRSFGPLTSCASYRTDKTFRLKLELTRFDGHFST